MNSQEFSDTDIAVVGMACRFPDADNLKAFWRNLREGVESVRTLSEEDLLEKGVDAMALSDPNYVKAGVILDNFDHFDADFFGFTPRDASIMDPQHRNFLELAWEALEHAGHDPARFEGAIGVFAGSGAHTYMMHNVMTNPRLLSTVGFFLLRHTGNDKDFLATRVSYQFDLRGPSVNIQTACSTSLVAIHAACQSLLNGECDMALAGGVTIEIPHGRGYLYQDGEILSPDGHCRAFDAKSAGTVFGSGAGIVTLRRFGDAMRDADVIHAVIKGSAVNNDGSNKVGYLAPSVDGHAEAVAEALALAQLDAGAVSYVETHGTGTEVGDPIEIAALTQAFRQSTDRTGFCRVGSLKTNIGHTDTAAGVASFIKTVLALKNKQIPPSLHFERPNPIIEFETSPFVVNRELTEWESDASPRTAGISSLGVGGTNAHVIVREAPDSKPSGPSREWKLLLLSARSKSALDSATDNLASYLEENSEVDLADVAHTLQVGRRAFQYRRALVCRDAEEACAVIAEADSQRVLTKASTDTKPSVVFMFPGGGAQYPNMGAELYQSEPVYTVAVDECLEILKRHSDVDLKSLMFTTEDGFEYAEQALQSPFNSILSVFITEYATAKLWMSWGVQPAAMTGHSLGEYTAACLAGSLTLDDAVYLVACRGQLFERVKDGAMLGVALPEDEVRSMMSEDLSIAAVNAPTSSVVSGNLGAIDRFEALLTEKEIDCQRLKISVPAHSPLLDPILDEFASRTEKIRVAPPKIPYIANLTGTWASEETVPGAEYWVKHLRQTVRFSDGLAFLLNEPGRVLLEVGPGSTLSSLARQQEGGPHTILSSLRHPKENVSDVQFILGALGRLWFSGVDVDWKAYYGDEIRRKVPLPTYPFERKRYWIDPGTPLSLSNTAKNEFNKQEDIADWFYKPTWSQSDLLYSVVSTKVDERPMRWLLFLDSSGVGSEVGRRLEAEGCTVVTVQQGDTFYRLGDGQYVIAPENRADYDALVEDLVDQELLPDRVAHFWLLTSDESSRAGSSFFHRVQEHGFYSLLFLTQALGPECLQAPFHFTVVSNAMQKVVAAERLKYPEKATVLGPCKVIPKEYPGVTCKSLDVDLGEFRAGRFATKARTRRVQQRFAALTKDLLTAESGVFAFRQENRWQQGFARLSDSTAANSRLREGGTYLITGGLGGIGYVHAEYLARTIRAKLVLLSRSPVPVRDDWEEWCRRHGESHVISRNVRKIQRLEALGAEVLPLAADVANSEQMEKAIATARDRFGPFHGVVHAAGTIDDGAMQLKTQSSAESVFSTKVYGTVLIDSLLLGTDLDFFILFSSTSTVFGPAGQVDYVAANAFLNAFAESKAGRSRAATIAINWGLWQQVGMAADSLKGQTADSAPGDSGEVVEHPLLDRRIMDTPEETVYLSEYTTQKHWMLDQHRTQSGVALVPGTGYLEIARAAVPRNGNGACVEIRDLFFLSPLQVDDSEIRQIKVKLSKTGDSYQFEVASRALETLGESPWQPHAHGNVGVRELPSAEKYAVHEIQTRCQRIESEADWTPLQAAHLKFGQRWDSLRELYIGDQEALAYLELPKEFAEDLRSYESHPALLDIATGFALRLIKNYDSSKMVYVPLSYKAVRARAALPSRIYSYIKSNPENNVERDVAEFDVVIMDEKGNVLIKIEQFVMKRLENLDAVSGSPARSVTSAKSGSTLSPQERELRLMLLQGIEPEEGVQAFEQIISSSSALPQVIVSSMDVHALLARPSTTGLEDDDSSSKFSRPELESTYVAPKDSIEKMLVQFWEDLLGVDKIGTQDNFFDLGGYSLLAVRLFAKIKGAFNVDYPISLLFEAPTIERCADMIRADVGGGALTGEVCASDPCLEQSLLIPLQVPENSTRTPFFLVAGMFGNVMNLRHLATHAGADQPFYAVQARGLLGNETPHTRFGPMAEEYLEQIRAVQPEGPYYLGGFSGGGIAAYEMAHQLLAQGEKVGVLVMLDTPRPHLPMPNRKDKLEMHWVKLRQERLSYVRKWVAFKARWELERGKRLLQDSVKKTVRPYEFRSEAIGEAFREALHHYTVRPYPGKVTLFRPELDKAYVLGPGRIVNSDRLFVYPDNGWTDYVEGGLDVRVVVGDHDSMVLEPHVRVLAAGLRECIDAAEAELVGSSS